MSTTAEGKLQAFETYLYHHEKAVTTIKKYICVVGATARLSGRA